jgi:hypothetical protein
MMPRFVWLFMVPLLACGEDTVAVTDASTGGTGVTSTTTETSTVTTGTTTTSGSDSETTSSTSPTTTAEVTSTGDTTQGVDTSTSTSTTTSTSTGTTTDDTTTTTTTTGDTTTTTGTTTDDTTGTTTGTTTGGEVLEPPMPAGLCATNDLTSFAEANPQAEELHVVSVYQATANAITVDVTRTDIPLTLVLSSYEPVAFTLVLAPGVLLEHVILNGYNAHTVQGQGAAVVTDLSGKFDFLAACGYFWPENDGGCDTPGLVAGAEGLTGLTLTSFVGCYEGASFSLD